RCRADLRTGSGTRFSPHRTARSASPVPPSRERLARRCPRVRPVPTDSVRSKPKALPTIVSSGNGRAALPTGIRILARGGSALDAVEACARVVEADPEDRSVGRGGLPNVLGDVELDASIVDGTSHAAGSVAALTGYLHPISVARGVVAPLARDVLVRAGAARCARELGAE